MRSFIRKIIIGTPLCVSIVLNSGLVFAGSVAEAEAGSQFGSLPVTQVFGLKTPMRDGVELAADMWLPKTKGQYPVILIRTPYEKTMPYMHYPALAGYFAQNGYAVVVQDVRGRGDSEGKFNFFFQEADDGYDTVEWIAKQPWSNGRVCMMGVSYLATVQWLAAKERPPHLKCLASTSPAGRYIDELPYIGGAFMMSWSLAWLNDTSGHSSQGPNAALIDWDEVYKHRPLLTMDEAMGRKMPLYRQFLQHPILDDYWKRIQLSPKDFKKIDLPVLTTTGEFDGDQTGAFFYWNGMNKYSKAAKDQYLIFGPWTHIESFLGGSDKVGGIALPPESVIDNKKVHLDFFDHYLKQTTEEFDAPRVQVFVTGINKWRYFDKFPIAGAKTKRLYFSSNGKANSLDGDGRLITSKPKLEKSDRFKFDPKNPVKLNLMGEPFGSDRKEVQKREDVLVYTTPPLTDELQVIGKMFVELYAATDARDTDFTAAISEVYPDGRVLLLGSKPVGIIRARYRNSLERTKLVTPGKVELYQIDLGYFAHAFLPGNKIRIEISSSAYPMFNPNQNTGNPVATDTEWKIAHQQIFHDSGHLSSLVMSIVKP